MATTVQVGTIFIENRPLIMRPLNLESESYSGNWGVLHSFTSSSLGQKVRGAGWTCAPLAGEVKATVFGSLAAKNIRRALKQIFLKARNLDFNCLEITKIVEDRFLGMARTTVWASSLHIQQGSIMQMVDEHKNAKPAAA
jgi:hypothetical protein